MSFPQTDVFLALFSLVSPNSFNSCLTHTVLQVIPFILCATREMRVTYGKQLKTQCPGIPIILVGIGPELRDHPNHIERLRLRGLKPVPEEQALVILSVIFQFISCICCCVQLAYLHHYLFRQRQRKWDVVCIVRSLFQMPHLLWKFSIRLCTHGNSRKMETKVHSHNRQLKSRRANLNQPQILDRQIVKVENFPERNMD